MINEVYSNYSGIIECDPANGIGIRLTIFLSGCDHHCYNCHNKQTWDFSYGNPIDESVFDRIRNYFKTHPYVTGLTISGGDPLHPKNWLTTKRLVEIGKEYNRNIWVYTGYTYEYLLKLNSFDKDYILENIDVLVDGPFINQLKDLRLRFRGSSNQRLIDMVKTRGNKEIILWDEKQ